MVGAKQRKLIRLGSSLREADTETTWRTAQQSMLRFGVSRVTDITSVDRLGLPVFCSVRARGHLLQVHAGKGVRADEARIGALMEAIEFAVAEPDATPWERKSTSADQLVAQFGHGLSLLDFVPQLGAEFANARDIAAVACEDLTTCGSALLPAELIFVPYDRPPAPKLFGWSGNGLASGNSVAEATLHGLFEVLERDAIAMNRAGDGSLWVDADTWPEPFKSIAASWKDVGVALAMRSLPNEWSLPCFEACLHDIDSTDVNLATGSGLHVDRDIAFARAVCEAAQSRLSAIHGGREDITLFYAKYSEQETIARRQAEATLVARKFDRSRSIGYQAITGATPDESPTEQILDDVMARLAATGLPTVFRYRFDVDLQGLSVVKVVVPRCEEVEHSANRIGARLLSRIIGAERAV